MVQGSPVRSAAASNSFAVHSSSLLLLSSFSLPFSTFLLLFSFDFQLPFIFMYKAMFEH